MKLIVGLGNPGIEYQFTPHNLGFLVIDRLAERHRTKITNRHCQAVTGRARIGGEDVLLAKPETYMNLSGAAVAELVEKYEADPARDLVVIYDELDLPLGAIRIRPRGSSAGHNGVKSVMGALRSEEFIRVRVGSAPDKPVRDGAKYGLSQIKKSQYRRVDEVLDRASEAVEAIVGEGLEAAMNRFNRKPEAEEKPRKAAKMKVAAKEALGRLAKAEANSVELLRHGSVQVKAAKAARSLNETKTHARDELYMVFTGSAECIVAGEREKLATGDFLLVPAHVEHRWENLSDDFAVWVVFYGPEGGEGKLAGF